MVSAVLTTIMVILGSLVTSVFSDAQFMHNELAAVFGVASTSAEVQNEPPTIETLHVAGNTGTPSSVFERTITFTGTINDPNGAGDVTRASLVAYRDTNALAQNCVADPNQCYRVPSCLLDHQYGSGTQTFFTCSISVPQAYAYGDWYAHATASDQDLATGTLETAFLIEPFSQKGSSGYLPPQATTTKPGNGPPPFVPPRSGEHPAEAAHTPTPGTTVIDLISLFYTQIGRREPATRRTPNHTESYGDFIRIAQVDTGLLVFNTSTDRAARGAIVELPAGTSRDWITLYVEPVSAADYPNFRPTPPNNMSGAAVIGVAPITQTAVDYTVVEDGLYHIYARNSAGDIMHHLTAPARITFIIPDDLSKARDLSLLHLDLDTNVLDHVTIMNQDAHTVSFEATDLGVFGLVQYVTPATVTNVQRITQQLTCTISIMILLLILIGIIILMIITIVRGNRESKTTYRDDEKETERGDTYSAPITEPRNLPDTSADVDTPMPSLVETARTPVSPARVPTVPEKDISKHLSL